MPPTPQQQASSTPPPGDYRYMGDHATEVNIGEALPWLEPGEIITLAAGDTTTGKIRYLIDNGILVDTATIVPDPEVEPQAQGTKSATQSGSDETQKGGK